LHPAAAVGPAKTDVITEGTPICDSRTVEKLGLWFIFGLKWNHQDSRD
jgi:hypothetical protein